MKRYGLLGVCWAMLVACASGGGSGESETHFFKCTTDLDCPATERCVARRCASTHVVASVGPSNQADSGAGGGRGSTGGSANTGGTGGGSGSLDGRANGGGTGGVPGSLDGATNAGGAGGMAAASSGGLAGDAGIGTSRDAAGTPGAGGAGGSVADATMDAGPSDASLADSRADAAPLASCNVTIKTLLTLTGYELDQIVLNGGYVYFHDSGGIWRVPRSGGTAEHLANANIGFWQNQHAFVVDDSGITWWDPTTTGDGSIVTNVNHVAKTGGPITTLATLAADGSMAYTSGALGPDGSVFLWSGPFALQPNLVQVRSDGTVRDWGRLPFYSNGVLFDGSDLFATGQNGVSIYLANSTFAGFTAFAAASLAKEMVLDDTTMYIGSGDTTGFIQLYSVPRTGGTSSPLWSASAGAYLGNLTVDANYLYVVERKPAAIVRMNKDGTNPTEIVKGVPQEEIESVAVDENCIYWAREGSLQGPYRSQSGVFAAPK